MHFFTALVNKILCSKIVRYIFRLCFLRESTIHYFNYIYEKSPHILTEFFVRMITPPKFDFKWEIFLSNGEKIKIDVKKDYTHSYELALSYKWHDFNLRKVETILNDFYENNYAYFDIGANHGLRSIYALSVGRPIVMFEPNPDIEKITSFLLKANDFKNCRIENIALSDRIDNIKFYISENTYQSSLEFNPSIKYEKQITVKTFDLDSYREKYFPELYPKIIKIDVEDHEVNVIKGSIEIIKKFSPSFIIEILKDSKNFPEICSIMKAFDYTVFSLNNGIFAKIRKIEDTSNIPKNINSNNYLFTKEKYIIDTLK